MPIITMDAVKYAYGSRYHTMEALKDVSCTFEQGKIYAIIGKSGSGKSTMLSLMAGGSVMISSRKGISARPTTATKQPMAA